MTIEQIVYNHLTTNLTNINIYSELPKVKPATFVRFERTGGSKTNMIDRATIAVQSYGSSLLESVNLNENVKTAMESLIERDDVSACQLEADYNFTDASTKHYRYQAVFSITYYK